MNQNGMQQQKETEIQSAILDYLRFRGHFCIRVNNIPATYIDRHGERQFRALSKYAAKGMSDIMLIRKPTGRLFGIEVKTPTGKMSPEQADFGRKLIEFGRRIYNCEIHRRRSKDRPMKYPIEPTPFAQFTLSNFDLWVRTHTPTQIELSDRQYAYLSNLMRQCNRDYNGFLSCSRTRRNMTDLFERDEGVEGSFSAFLPRL